MECFPVPRSIVLTDEIERGNAQLVFGIDENWVKQRHETHIEICHTLSYILLFVKKYTNIRFKFF